MKRTILTLLLAVLFFPVASFAKRPTVRLLAIGNSFSCNAVEKHLHEIAEADSVVLIIGNLYIGGCSIDTHLKNIRNDAQAYSYRKIGADGVLVTTPKYQLSHAIVDEPWDYVTVQQVSSLSGIPSSYNHLPDLVSWVRSNAPRAHILLHQTWAYAKDAKHPDFKHYDHDQAHMTAMIQYASTLAARQVGISTIIPCLRAVSMWREYVPESMVTIDGFHLEPRVARYLASLTWYATISGHPVFGNSYRPNNVSDAEVRLAQAVADFAVFGITSTLNSLPPLPLDEPPAAQAEN